MLSFLKLIRWPNLVIMLVSMIFILLLVINPILNTPSFEAGMSLFQFVLLLISTLLITAGGYVINDFFDMQSDSINKPGINQVGKKYAVARIQLLYWIFTILGVLTGTYLCWVLDQLNYALIFVFAAGLLWFYSERYKCMPLVGNIVVAFLSALSFGLVWIFEFFALTNNPASFGTVQSMFPLVNHFVLMYMGFAFLVSLTREVVKDIEDIEGDKKFGCKTFAVAYGEKKSKSLAMIIAFGGLLFSVWFQVMFFQAEFYILFGYFIAIDLLFIMVVIWLSQAKKKSDYKKLAFFIKMTMLIGIFSMFLVYFELF
jgi:4-hydroxybenzoate polyprenyltransferase